MFGLETGSPKLLDAIHKKITPQDVIALFNVLKQFDFTVTTFLMCGFPGETRETVRETIDLVKATQKIYYNCIVGIGKLWVYPGTEVYAVMKKSGAISDDFWLGEQPVPYFTVEHELSELNEFEETMMDSLSITRITSLSGFRKHFLSMPLVIVRFLLQSRNRDILVNIIADLIHRIAPSLHTSLRKLYRRLCGR
jgi:radical SAM superfamily enzyme YgiQ (UPF0313 family)